MSKSSNTISSTFRYYSYCISSFNNDSGYLNKDHNSSSTAHSDIRTALSNITSKLNLFFDTNDTAFDQLTEIITYIKLNRDKANSALESLNGLDSKYLLKSALPFAFSKES